MEITIFAALGFFFAAYAVVGNDALQTLGTFINSNARLHWFWLFLFAGAILVFTFSYGWVINDGDPSWGRLAKTSKYPVVDIQWYHTLPPLVLLIITRFGVPVSTSFMVLTVFATVGGMTSMLQKSLIGYGLAFIVGLGVYLLISRSFERFFKNNDLGAKAPWGLASIMGAIIAVSIYFVPPLINPEVKYTVQAAICIFLIGVTVDVVASMAVLKFKSSAKPAGLAVIAGGLMAIILYNVFPITLPVIAVMSTAFAALLFVLAMKIQSGNAVYWIILQWITTGYLWGVWLIQDFANIFVFLPRELTALQSFAAMGAILVLLAYTFWNKGGPVQKILQAKTAVTDIRSATIIDFIYASLLFFFKEVSDIPMSTTFVFLGLIAGREYGFAIMDKSISFFKTCRLSVSDVSKAYIGLVLSINMAVGLPLLARALTENEFTLESAMPSPSYQTFILIANALLIPVIFYLRDQKSKPRMILTSSALAIATAAFFIMPPG